MIDDETKPPEWITRVRVTAIFYANQIKENPKYTLRDLQKDLNRSIGRLSEDLMLHSFMKTHPKVETYRKVTDAVEYCRKLKKLQKERV